MILGAKCRLPFFSRRSDLFLFDDFIFSCSTILLGDCCFSGLGFFSLLAQQFLQHFNAFIHVFFLQQERRQKAQNRILGDVKEHALCQALLNQRTRRNVEHQALNEAAAAALASNGIFLDQTLKLLAQVATNFFDIFQKVFLFHDRQVFESDAACQWATSKGGAVLAGRNCVGELLF